jgi:hypothetical protein
MQLTAFLTDSGAHKVAEKLMWSAITCSWKKDYTNINTFYTYTNNTKGGIKWKRKRRLRRKRKLKLDWGIAIRLCHLNKGSLSPFSFKNKNVKNNKQKERKKKLFGRR